jgi:dTDP-4-dehydrorhamnose 3,5-epimerase-like enzyme
MVIDQDKQVFGDNRGYFKELVESTNFKQHMKLLDNCQEDILGFLQRMRALEGHLDNQQTRIKTLLRGLEKDTSLVGFGDFSALGRFHLHRSV